MTVEDVITTPAAQFPTAQYIHDQINYIADLREQAIRAGDVPKDICVSVFMVKHYLPLGYDSAFNLYWNGERHKAKWREMPGHEKKQAAYSPLSPDFDPHRFP